MRRSFSGLRSVRARFLLIGVCGLTSSISCTPVADADRTNPEPALRPYEENPRYWQYQGKPVMLLGGNETDSPYLLDDPEAYFKELARIRGNYCRYVVKQRLDSDLVQLFPHKQLPDGRYDLNRWNEAYWSRFEEGIRIARDLGIIVQLELWDRFDFGTTDNYRISPWHPANNITYTASESGLPVDWEGKDNQVHRHPFFHAIPARDNNPVLLEAQKKFADKVLSITLKYDNVLYAITNESTLNLEWSDFWAGYIRKQAAEADKVVQVSEMPWTIADRFPFGWQPPALGMPDIWINHVIEHPELYSFCAFHFQPILVGGQDHYDRLAEVYNRVQASSSGDRPVNAVKIFAHPDLLPLIENLGKEPNAQTRYWRPLMAGWAGLSFHRATGRGYLAFSVAGKNCLQAARTFTDLILPWECSPRQDLLQDRESDEAYLLANPGKAYGVYFPTSGSVTLDPDASLKDPLILRWISLETGECHGQDELFEPGAVISLKTPPSGSTVGWTAALTVNPNPDKR